LLLEGFYGNEAHVRPGDCFAYRLGVVPIVLAALAIWDHELRRHQLHRVPEGAESTCPLVRSRARFHADKTRGQLRNELGELRSRQASPHHRCALRIYRVHGKHILCQVDSNCRNYAHGASPFERMDLATLSWHFGVTSGRGSPLHSLGVAECSGGCFAQCLWHASALWE